VENVVASMEDAVDLSKFNANVAFDRESEAAEEVQEDTLPRSPRSGSSSPSPRRRIGGPPKLRFHWHSSRVPDRPSPVRTLFCRSFFSEWTPHDHYVRVTSEAARAKIVEAADAARVAANELCDLRAVSVQKNS